MHLNLMTLTTKVHVYTCTCTCRPDVEEGQLREDGEGVGERNEGEVHVQPAIQSAGKPETRVEYCLQQTSICRTVSEYIIIVNYFNVFEYYFSNFFYWRENAKLSILNYSI